MTLFKKQIEKKNLLLECTVICRIYDLEVKLLAVFSFIAVVARMFLLCCQFIIHF